MAGSAYELNFGAWKVQLPESTDALKSGRSTGPGVSDRLERSLRNRPLNGDQIRKGR